MLDEDDGSERGGVVSNDGQEVGESLSEVGGGGDSKRNETVEGVTKICQLRSLKLTIWTEIHTWRWRRSRRPIEEHTRRWARCTGTRYRTSTWLVHRQRVHLNRRNVSVSYAQ